MGQPLLQVGLNAPVAASDKKPVSDRVAAQNNNEESAFSSTLNQQLEKTSERHNTSTHKANSVDKKQSKEDVAEQNDVSLKNTDSEITTKETSDSQAEQTTDESGNNLPVMDAELTELNTNNVEQQDSLPLTDEEQNVVATETVNIVNTQAMVTDGSKLAASSKGSDKSTQKAVTPQPNLTKAVVSAENKTAIAEAVETELEPTATESKSVLRSDILHAISNKKENKIVTGKDASVVTKEFSLTGQKQVEVPMNERQKMAQLLASSQADGKVLTDSSKPVATTFSSLLTSTATASSQASTASSTNLLAPQTTSVGQSVFSMQPSVQSEAWGKVLSSRVVWMAREGVQQAELRLNPAELGPVKVKMAMNNEQANITFIAHHAATRDALEQALPRLRESFQENGMNLANADVSDQASEQQNEDQGAGDTLPNSHGVAIQQGEHSHEQEQEGIQSSSGELDVGVSVFA